MATQGWSSRVITSLRGAWTKLALIKAKSNRSFVATNVRFPPGRVTTRDGFANRLAVASKVTSLYNWVAAALDQVIYMEGTAVKIYDVVSAAVTSLYTVASGRAAVVAEGASRAFIAVFNTSGSGQTEARIVNAIAGYPADKAFAGPMAVTSIAATDTVGAGTITAGLHYFGFIMQSRTGFAGKPSPVVAGVFTPASLTAAGGKKAHLAVTANIPADAAFAYPIMTRVDNPDKWYFIPEGMGGDVNGLPGGASGFSFSWDIDITDEDLAARATSADDNFGLATQNTSGVGPMSPGYVKQYGNRMVYIDDEDVWISDPNDHQSLTTALHKIRMPGDRRSIAALVIRGVLYPIGPTWTYAVADRGGLTPREWGAPQLVSGALGTLSPLGVTDRTAGDYGWVANQTGLFIFRSVYEEKPITYLCAEWDRINWAAAYAVEVVDDFVRQRVLVGAPLDAATEMTHIFVIDYSQGMTPYDVDISLFTYNANLFASGLFSSLGLVQETDNKSVLWVGPAASGQILKEVPLRRDDQGVAIHGIYETGHVLNEGDSKQSSRVSRLQIGVKGAGPLTPTIYGPDRIKSKVAPTITLSAAPDRDEEVQFDLSDVDNFSVRLETNAVDAWFDLARIKPFWRGMWTNR